MSKLRALFKLLKDTFQQWNEDKAPRLAAALAYYTAFSLAPLLIVLISVAGLIFGEAAVQGKVEYQIQQLVGLQAASAIQDILTNFNHPQTSLLATVIGIATLLLGAAGLFGALQDALDTIWEVKPKPQGLIASIRYRFVSFTMVLGVGFILLVSLVISAALSALGTWISVQIPEQTTLLQILNIVISFGVELLLFGMIYKVLPDVEISWRDVWMGAFVTALLFTIGKYLIGLYLGMSSVASGYGAAGSLVVLLLWINYSAQILLFGAEFTQVYATAYGAPIVPSRNAVPLTERDRLEQGIPHEATDKTPGATPTGTPEARHSAGQPPSAVPEAAVPRPAHLGQTILGICAALATFVVGLLIGTDRRKDR